MTRKRDKVVQFGPFRLDAAHRRLTVGPEDVRIGGRGMDILLALASRPGKVVDKASLMKAGWPDVIVDDTNLKVTIAQLRRALRDYAPNDDFIHNVVGRGYWLGVPDKLRASPNNRPVDSGLPKQALLIGRERELAQLVEMISASRLTTIVGPGGIGKTALAVALASEKARHRSPVHFVDLSRVQDEEFVAASLAAAIGIDPGSSSLLAVCSILERQEALLVLDTCEHVLQAVAHVCDVLLSRTERVTILATSRETLRARGETLLWLSPLAIPPADDFDLVAPVLQFAAPRLLARRASEVSGWLPRDEDARALVQICREVEGSPLAIELVAPRLAVVGAERTRKELEHGLMDWRRKGKSGPRRQRTLLDTLRWSYALLPAQEAATLRAASTFAGSFTAEAAIAVAEDQALTPLEILDALSALRLKSMLSVELARSEPRYRLLDSTRAFAAGLAEQQEESTRLSLAHARWVLDRLFKIEGERVAMPRAQWRRGVEHLVHDLRKAVDFTLRRAANPVLGIDLVVHSLRLLLGLSLNEEIDALCRMALGELRRVERDHPTLELELLVTLASVSTYSDRDPEDATTLFREAIELSRRCEDGHAECRALAAYATFELLRGKSEPARIALKQMRTAASRAQDPTARWEEEQLRAQYEIRTRHFGRALARIRRLSGEMADELDRAAPTFQIHQRLNVQVQMAALNWLTGHFSDAVDVAASTAEDVRSAEHGLTIVHCLAQGVCWTLFQCGKYDAVRPQIETLREMIYRHGIAAWVPVADTYSAVVAAYSTKSADPHLLRDAFQAVRNGAPQIRHDARFTLIADAMIANGQVDDAANVIRHVFATSTEPWCKSELLRLHAAIENQRGHFVKAAKLGVSAYEEAQKSDSLAWRLRSATDLAAIYQRAGETKRALDLLLPLCRQFEKEAETLDLRRTRSMLGELAAG